MRRVALDGELKTDLYFSNRLSAVGGEKTIEPSFGSDTVSLSPLCLSLLATP
jgi:hypothetical protein